MGVGRPPKPEKDRRTASIKVMLTDSELNTLDAAAKSIGEGTSTWIRRLALQAASQMDHGKVSPKAKKRL